MTLRNYFPRRLSILFLVRLCIIISGKSIFSDSAGWFNYLFGSILFFDLFILKELLKSAFISLSNCPKIVAMNACCNASFKQDGGLLKLIT